MVKRLIFTFLILNLSVPFAWGAIDVVYPSQSKLTVNSNETFFSGNVDDGSSLTINNLPVKLHNNRYFVEMVPLNYGENKIVLKSKNDEKIFYITRPKPTARAIGNGTTSNTISYSKFDGIFISGKTNNSRSTLRDKPSTSGNRLIDLPEGILLNIDGIKNDYYHLAKTAQDLWIHKSNIEKISENKDLKLAHLKKHKHYEDELYYYEKFYFTHLVPYTIKQDVNAVKITFYDVSNNPDNKYEFEVYPDVVLGYDCITDNNAIIFRYAKQPKITSEISPLKGINIFIDAGHGGSETGTISPERVYEKNITLNIALTLINLLRAEGANVYFSRLDDSQVDLYKRVDIAKQNSALISVSIHVNSLPYGKNPYIIHGTEVHYYNDNAKYLANIIQTNLANDLNIKPNGVIKSSFALTRCTNPISVLVETAYMLNPNEYQILKNSVHQRNMAKSIRNSLEQFVIAISAK